MKVQSVADLRGLLSHFDLGPHGPDVQEVHLPALETELTRVQRSALALALLQPLLSLSLQYRFLIKFGTPSHTKDSHVPAAATLIVAQPSNSGASARHSVFILCFLDLQASKDSSLLIFSFTVGIRSSPRQTSTRCLTWIFLGSHLPRNVHPPCFLFLGPTLLWNLNTSLGTFFVDLLTSSSCCCGHSSVSSDCLRWCPS